MLTVLYSCSDLDAVLCTELCGLVGEGNDVDIDLVESVRLEVFDGVAGYRSVDQRS